MSFILDALKKSESDRQQQSGAEFSSVPSGSSEAHPYKWLWILAFLLLVNFAALLIVLLRPGAEPQAPAPIIEPRAEAGRNEHQLHGWSLHRGEPFPDLL